jgi:hypothetical protein
MMDREYAASEFFDAHIAPTLERVSDIAADMESAKDAAIHAFGSVCEKVAALQKEKALGDVIMVHFSFLRTGLAERKGIYRIDMCDENWLTNTSPCHGYWEAAFAFGPYFGLVDEWKHALSGFGRNLREADIDYFALGLSIFPQLAANALLANIAVSLGTLPAYKALSRRDCVISVGEYRDAQTTIYEDGDGGAA